MATRDSTWAEWDTAWWDRQAIRGGLLGGIVLAPCQVVVDAALHGPPAGLRSLRLAASVLLGPEVLDPESPPGPPAVTGLIVHLTVAAVAGLCFAGILARSRLLRRSGEFLVVGAALYALVFGLVCVYCVAPAMDWPWIAEATNPLLLTLGNAVFFGVPLGLRVNAAAVPRRRLGLV